MGYKKRELPKVVLNSKKRLAAMKLIDVGKPAPVNYGSIDRPLSSVEFNAQVVICDALNEEYDSRLAAADGALNEVIDAEAILSRMYAEILSSAKGRFGSDSSELEQLGGTRLSERKRRSTKKPPPAP
ncbi:MAG: hypothetical protein WCJ01_01625 [Ignavibacteria bacterium]